MRLIDADALIEKAWDVPFETENAHFVQVVDVGDIMDAPTISPDSLRPKGLYTAHEVAEIIAELFGDNCACNFNGIDEWLSEKCELGDACPNTVGVACWEQYLKHRHNCGADMTGDDEHGE